MEDNLPSLECAMTHHIVNEYKPLYIWQWDEHRLMYWDHTRGRETNQEIFEITSKHGKDGFLLSYLSFFWWHILNPNSSRMFCVPLPSVAALCHHWSCDSLLTTHIPSWDDPVIESAPWLLATEWVGSLHHHSPDSCFLVILDVLSGHCLFWLFDPRYSTQYH